MATQAKAAVGTQLTRNGVLVDEIKSITGPSQKAKDIDATNMDSPSAFSETIIGILDGGEVQASGNWWASTQQTGVLTDFQNKVLQTWAILLPGTQPAAGHWNFSGFVNSFALEFKHDGAITYNFSIKITGKPTFAVV